MERHFRDALEEDEVVYDHSQFGLLNNSSADDSYNPLTEQANPSARKIPPDRARCGKLLRTAALCGAYISLGMCMAVTGPTLPFLKDQVGSTVAEISWIFTARSAGTLGGSFMGGLVLDRFNPYSIFFLTVAAMALGTGAMPWCKHLWMLMVASIMVGIANGFLDTGASTVCLRLWGKESGPYMQAMQFAFAVGGSLAPLLVQAFIGETTALLQHSNITTLPFSTGTPATSIRHVREAIIADQDNSDSFGNTTVTAILKAVTQNPVVELNTNLTTISTTLSTEKSKEEEKSGTVIESSEKLDGNLNSTTLSANTTTTTEKPPTPRPKPAKIDGGAIGSSDKFDKSPLILEPAVPVPTTTASTTVIGNTTITTPSTTPLSSNITTTANSTLVNAEVAPSSLNETATNSPIINASSTAVNGTQNLPDVNTNSTELIVTSSAVLITTSTTTAPSTTTSTTTEAPTTTSTTTAAPTTTTTSTTSTTIAPIPTFPVATADAVNVTKSRGKSRGQQLEGEVTTTTTVSPEINHSGTIPTGGKTYANYLELFGVTRMHLLYTVIAIIVLHTAFSFLFFLCSSSDNRASSIAASAESRKLSGEQSNFRPRPKLIFVGLLFSFYLLYVGAEVVFAQFLTTFALESHLHVSTSAANYVTTTFWAAFAAARFGAIFFAHFTSPTVMLLLNLGLTTIGSLILCIAAQSSIYVLYIGSALIGIGMASTFATGFVWTEKHLLVTNRISASFSIASAMGEMIFPTMTGALMESSSMSLMYVVLVANLLCVTTFLAARMLAKSQGGSRSGRGYQLAAQQADEEESYLAHH